MADEFEERNCEMESEGLEVRLVKVRSTETT